MKISNKIKSLAAATVIAIASLGVIAPTYINTTPAYAKTTTTKDDDDEKVDCPSGSINKSADTLAQCNVEADAENKDLMSTLKQIINVILAATGFISVVILIIGGISYSTSAGDAGRVKKAKDTIMYGVIGLVISLLAFAIVNFVLTSIF